MEHLSTQSADHGHAECRKCGECRCGGRDSRKQADEEDTARTASDVAAKTTLPAISHAL